MFSFSQEFRSFHIPYLLDPFPLLYGPESLNKPFDGISQKTPFPESPSSDFDSTYQIMDRPLSPGGYSLECPSPLSQRGVSRSTPLRAPVSPHNGGTSPAFGP